MQQMRPTLRSDLPLYPQVMQAVRVTGGTVPGPSGYMSSSVLGPSLYIGFVQQLGGDTLLPRDREPCLVNDLNRVGLAPGYYTDARLAGSHGGLPVYEVGGAPVASPLAAMTSPPLPAESGITPAQAIALQTLSPAQVQVLANLTPCQLVTLVNALPISQIHTVTSSVLTPTQLATLINHLTITELQQLYQQLTTSQIITLTTVLNQFQIQSVVQTLTPAQIQALITGLTSTQLDTLGGLPPQDVETLVTDLSTTQLGTLLDVAPLPTPIPGRVSLQTGTSYNFSMSDSGKLLRFSNGSSIAGSLPNPTTLGPRWNVHIWNAGAGTLTLTPVSGTINGASSFAVESSKGSTVWSDGSNYYVESGGAGVTGGGGGGSSILDVNWVTTGEATSSTSFVDLSTIDRVTFTLDEASEVLVLYFAVVTVSGGITTETAENQMEVDGTDDTTTVTSTSSTATANIIVTYCIGVFSLDAGSHTIDVEHKTIMGTSTSWADRVTVAFLMP